MTLKQIIKNRKVLFSSYDVGGLYRQFGTKRSPVIRPLLNYPVELLNPCFTYRRTKVELDLVVVTGVEAMVLRRIDCVTLAPSVFCSSLEALGCEFLKYADLRWSTKTTESEKFIDGLNTMLELVRDHTRPTAWSLPELDSQDVTERT